MSFGICKCFFSHNIFLKKYNLHINFLSETQFIAEYSKVLQDKGCISIQDVLLEVKNELQCRQELVYDTRQRRRDITQKYERLYPDLTYPHDKYFDAKFFDVVRLARQSTHYENLLPCIKFHSEGIVSFPVFSMEFCKKIVEEVEQFENSNLAKIRPNTMNRYGVSLDELGFEDFICHLRKDYLESVARLIFPEWVGQGLDSHKAFVVVYRYGEDVDLSYHYDNSEITLNISLNSAYEDGDIYFGPMRYELNSSVMKGYSHVLGHGVLHRGQQLHGAFPITSGERYNLIIWLRSSSVRNTLCPMCNEIPKFHSVPCGFGDGFYQEKLLCILS